MASRGSNHFLEASIALFFFTAFWSRRPFILTANPYSLEFYLLPITISYLPLARLYWRPLDAEFNSVFVELGVRSNYLFLLPLTYCLNQVQVDGRDPV